MATYTVVNGSPSQLVNINVGGVDVDALTFKDGITLTATELATLLDGATFGHKNIAVFADLTGDAAAATKKRNGTINAYLPST